MSSLRALPLLLVLSTPALAGPLTVVGLNAGANAKSELELVTEVIGRVGGMEQVDVWGLTETQRRWWLAIERTAELSGGDFRPLTGHTGGPKLRLMIVFNKKTVELVEGPWELPRIGGGRAPLVAQFRHRSSGTEFLFVVNHLLQRNSRGNERESRALVEWGAKQTLPIVMVGDYNYNFHVNEDDSRVGYRVLIEGGVFSWVRPDELEPTQCNRRFSSVLDFVFAGNAAQNWTAESEILFDRRDYCQELRPRCCLNNRPRRDCDCGPDHLPVTATFAID